MNNDVGANASQGSVLRSEICQGNPLIEARKHFDLLGMKIFLLGLQGLNPHFSANDRFYDEDFQEIFISTAKLTELFGNTWYLHDLDKVCDKMFRTVVKIKSEYGSFELSHLFRRLEYVPGEGLYLWFDDILRPYILDLMESRGYTRINVGQIFKLSSLYAIRLLELMLQYQNVREFKLRQEITREIKIDDLRFMLNVPDGAYEGRLNNFRKFVLDDPIREINTRTVYELSYTTVKKGRRVVGFEFHLNIERAPLTELNGYKPLINTDVLETLMSLGFTEKAARAIFSKCLDVDDCFSRINRAQALLHRSKKPVENKLGFLRKAIENDWRVTGSSRSKNSTSTTGNAETYSEPISTATLFKPIISRIEKTQKISKADASKTPETPIVETATIKGLKLKKTAYKKNKYNLTLSIIQEIAERIASKGDLEAVHFILAAFGLTLDKFLEEFIEE